MHLLFLQWVHQLMVRCPRQAALRRRREDSDLTSPRSSRRPTMPRSRPPTIAQAFGSQPLDGPLVATAKRALALLVVIGGRSRAGTAPVAGSAHMVAVDLTLGSQIVAARLQSSTKWTRVHRRGLTNFTKGGQKGAGFRCPERARISWGKAIAGSGVRGTDLSRSGQRCKDTPCLRKVQLRAIGPARIRAAARFVV